MNVKWIILFLFLLSNFNSYGQNYNYIYNEVKKIPTQNYSNINELYNTIVKPNYNDAEKVYAFAKFITDKIAYGKRARSPLNTINTGEGVCQDYSELFIELCDLASINNYYITGNGRNSVQDIGFYDSNHSWNIVKLNGKYEIFDLTWAAGYVSDDNFIQQFDPFYFNTDPKLFILNHFPDNPKWQLLNVPVLKTDYINQPSYDQSIYNLSLKKGIVSDNNFDITFSSSSNFHSASVYKWGIKEYGQKSAIDLPITKNGDRYKININELNEGAYKYNIVLWRTIEESANGSTSTGVHINFKLRTPDYTVPRPVSYNKKDPWGLIESYHYIFYKLDFNFFKKLNPNTDIKSLKEIKHYSSLTKSLSNWFGDYRNFYTKMRGNDIYYEIDNFRIILTLKSDDYLFKEIIRQTLKMGKSGYGVKEIQKVFGLETTGIFDENLENKIKNFQKQKGLTADGVVGKMTYKALGL